MESKLTIELLDSEADENDPSPREVEKWSAYVDRYAKSSNKEKDDVSKSFLQHILYNSS